VWSCLGAAPRVFGFLVGESGPFLENLVSKNTACSDEYFGVKIITIG